MNKIKRNPNFSPLEIQVLVEEIDNHKHILFSRQNTTVTNAKKKIIWESICNKVNMVNSSAYPRVSEDLRRKWSALCSAVKSKLNTLRKEARKTGMYNCFL